MERSIIWDEIWLHTVRLSVIGQRGAIESSDWLLHCFTGGRREVHTGTNTRLLYCCECKVNALTSVPPRLPPRLRNICLQNNARQRLHN